MVGGPLEPRSAATSGGHEEDTAGPGSSAAFLHPNLEQRTGHRIVCFAYGDGVARCARRDGRNAVCNWDLWHGCVLGQQAAEGIGNSYGPRSATSGSVAGSVGTGIQIAGSWFGSR